MTAHIHAEMHIKCDRYAKGKFNGTCINDFTAKEDDCIARLMKGILSIWINYYFSLYHAYDFFCSIKELLNFFSLANNLQFIIHKYKVNIRKVNIIKYSIFAYIQSKIKILLYIYLYSSIINLLKSYNSFMKYCNYILICKYL